MNLRSGPGTSFPIVASIPFGAAVSVTGDPVDAVWVPVTYNGQAGFVMGEFLSIGTAQSNASGPSPTPPPSAAPTPAPAPSPQAAAVGTGGPGAATWATVTPPDGLNLRQGPGTGFAVLIAVPGGARVQVVGLPSPEGWYSVVYQNRLGWVDGKYLSFGAPAPASATPTPTPAPGTGPRPAPPPAIAPAAPSRFIWPVESRKISTVFSASHPGIDIDEYPNGNNPVAAVAAGTVTFAGGDACCSYGLYVIVKHTDGYTSLYAHLSSINVSEGQTVRQGGLVGKSGNTGFSTGVHLHLEIRKEGVAIDPLTLLPGPSVIE